MDIVRNADGTLVVPIPPERHHETDDDTDTPPLGDEDSTQSSEAAPATRVLHPGEGGYDEALAEWDLQQNPDAGPVVSTASGRQEAMAVVHAVATLTRPCGGVGGGGPRRPASRRRSVAPRAGRRCPLRRSVRR